MAGNQIGLGRMFQSIGQSMSQWGEQKRQAEAAAMQRALQARQLELQEQANERQKAELDAQLENAEFNRTLQVANVMPEGAALDATLSGQMKKHGMGGFIKPAAPETLPIPTGIHGGMTPVNIPMPERMIATQPPGFRQADQRNQLLASQHVDNMGLKIQALQAKIEQQDRANDIAGLRASTAQLMALIAQTNSRQQGGNMDVDNNAAYENRALAYAKALIDGNIMLTDPVKRQAAMDAAIADWKSKNPPPAGVSTGAAPATGRSAGPGNGRSGIF
jgi:hypothetical protein